MLYNICQFDIYYIIFFIGIGNFQNNFIIGFEMWLVLTHKD